MLAMRMYFWGAWPAPAPSTPTVKIIHMPRQYQVIQFTIPPQ